MSGSPTGSIGPALHYFVTPEQAGQRVDVFLGRQPDIGSRSRAASFLQAGRVLVCDKKVHKSHILEAGEWVTVLLPDTAPAEPATEPVNIPIVYEDDWLVVVDKPAGIAVHPSPGHREGTLVQLLTGHGLAGGEAHRPGVVHRLDKDTSGLMVVAKEPAVHRLLAAAIARRQVRRRYQALVHGGFEAESGTIEAPVGRDPVRRKTMAIGGVAARMARTHFRVLERLGDYTLLDVSLETGRTHQIRVHFLAIGHPVVGDPVYTRRDPFGLGRQFLHSYELAFVHPATGEQLRFESPLPEALASVLGRLREERGL